MSQHDDLRCTKCGKVLSQKIGWKRTSKGLFCRPCLLKLYKEKGYKGERDFVKKLRKLGYNALRMGVSGAGTEPIPDIVAFHPEKREALAFEVKSVTAKRWTVFAYKDKERKIEGQIIKALKWLRLMYPEDITKKAGVAVKFLLGERVKSPWIVKFVPNHEDLTQVEDVTVDITDESDMPELTAMTKSKRARRIIKKRKRKKRV
jgi:Holliday junction resolvase